MSFHKHRADPWYAISERRVGLSLCKCNFRLNSLLSISGRLFQTASFPLHCPFLLRRCSHLTSVFTTNGEGYSERKTNQRSIRLQTLTLKVCPSRRIFPFHAGTDCFERKLLIRAYMTMIPVSSFLKKRKETKHPAESSAGVHVYFMRARIRLSHWICKLLKGAHSPHPTALGSCIIKAIWGRVPYAYSKVTSPSVGVWEKISHGVARSGDTHPNVWQFMDAYPGAYSRRGRLLNNRPTPTPQWTG